MEEGERLITFAAAGEMLGRRSVKTIRRLIAGEVLPEPVYIGRTPMLLVSDVVGLIERLKQERKERGLR
jgi:hypothetical protein